MNKWKSPTIGFQCNSMHRQNPLSGIIAGFWTYNIILNFLQDFECPRCSMWNSQSPCGAESVAERRSSHCWTSWLALDKENHWRSTPAVAPDGWVQWALHNPPICCSLLPLDGAAQNDLGIESSQVFTHPTILGAKPCLKSMITWQALFPRPYSLSL